MSDISYPENQSVAPGSTKQSLGLGRIISDTFDIFFRRFPVIFLICLVPSSAGLVMSSYAIGIEAALGLTAPSFTGLEDSGPFLAAVIAGILVSYIASAFLVQLTYDAKLNRPVRLSHYILPTLVTILPVVIIGLVSTVLTFLATIALVIPGLWVSAVFVSAIPAIVIERVGFRGLQRSAELTKGYRWPIVVVVLLAGFVSQGMTFLATYLAGLVNGAYGLTPTVVLFIALVTISIGLTSVPVALIYARLREIKDGVSVDDLAAVFD
ncbi:hypothetical protein [Roseibium sp.]|uniref:hypothetical protein n=1 Tax=Roseibium sp. TaxID=1936156 RepID=UPI003BB15D76